jgi:hypothetical protein
MKIFQRIYTYEDEENFHAAMVFEGGEGKRKKQREARNRKTFSFCLIFSKLCVLLKRRSFSFLLRELLDNRKT